MTVSALSPSQILALALKVARREESHWTTLCEILGVVEQDRLYATPEYGEHASLRAWAMDVLGLGSGDVGLLRRLFTMVRTSAEFGVPLEDWAKLSRSRAEMVLKAVKLGGPVRVWVDAALVNSATEMEEALARLKGEDVWVDITVSVPAGVKEMYDEARRQKLPEVTGQPNPDPKLIDDSNVHHQLFELIVLDALQGRGAANADRPHGDAG